MKVRKPDSSWSWIVVACGFISNMIVFGCSFCFGVLYPELLQEFKESKAKTAWIGSLGIAFLHLFGPLAARLIDRFGCRLTAIFGAFTSAVGLAVTSQAPNALVMYITYSTISSFGVCCVWTAVYTIVPRYFLRRRFLAISLMACGPGSGFMVMSVVIEALQNSYGWRGAFIGMAGITLFVCALATTFSQNVEGTVQNEPHRDVRETGANSVCFDLSLLRNRRLVIVVISTAVIYLGHFVPQVHLARHCEDLNISLAKSARLLIHGIMSVFFRIITGRLCDVKSVNVLHIYHGAVFVAGAATITLPLATSYAGLVAYTTVYGSASGSFNTCVAVLVISSVNKRRTAQAFGFWSFTISFTIALGPPFAGFLADTFKSYAPAFYIAGVTVCIGNCIAFFLKCSSTTEPVTTEEALPAKDEPSERQCCETLLVYNTREYDQLIVMERETVP